MATLTSTSTNTMVTIFFIFYFIFRSPKHSHFFLNKKLDLSIIHARPRPIRKHNATFLYAQENIFPHYFRLRDNKLKASTKFQCHGSHCRTFPPPSTIVCSHTFSAITSFLFSPSWLPFRLLPRSADWAVFIQLAGSSFTVQPMSLMPFFLCVAN